MRPEPSTPTRRSGIARARAVELALALLVLLALGACNTTVQRRDWSAYTGPGAQYFQAEEIPFPHVDDPLEPANRILAGVDHALAQYLIAPLASAYRAIVPKPTRTRLRRMGENFLYPTRVINNLLQGKWKAAKEETQRFGINTTVGVLGLFDPALKRGLQPHPEDFGQTFAHWGWHDSTYVYLPILGPSTIRDGLGEIPNAYSDPASYYWPLSAGRRFNAASDKIEDALRAVRVNYDAYEPARTLYVLQREVDVENFSWRRDESGPTQSLDSIFLAPEDPDFVGRAIEESVLVPTGKELPFTLWLQPHPAPLVYLVPGLGGHRLGNASIALAEIAYKNGNSVVAISNPTNWEFMALASSAELPGYAPVDAHDVHVALTRIDQRLEALHPRSFISKRLTGISLGALYTLFLAANEDRAKAEGLLAFDVYLALDPAVDLEHALLQLDRFYNAPLALPQAERAQRIEEIFGKVLYLSRGELEPGTELPFTELESRFLIGLAYRLDLQFMILQSQQLHDQGVLRTKDSFLQRAPAFREASEYSYMEYVYAFMLPYLAAHEPGFTFDEPGARRIFERCDLRSIESGLRANERVLVFANENDFLLRPEDITWLKAVLGSRAHFFEAGGHLGNLHRKRIQEVIDAAIEEKAEETGAQSAVQPAGDPVKPDADAEKPAPTPP